jgi:glycosyltransferase involved in cell wall biosynthesis
MTRLGLRPYQRGDFPAEHSVPVTVVVLTQNEELNIARCLQSVAWADQVLVVDSGSTDGTLKIATGLGAEVVEQPWLGYSGQREFALRLDRLRHEWVYFVDADEWVSPHLAGEIAELLTVAPGRARGDGGEACTGYSQRLRLVFGGRWIRHCGWYSASPVIRLVDRRHARFDGASFGERARVDGRVGRLRNDIVDEDLKGLAAWLHKHVRYAELEAQRRNGHAGLPQRLRRVTGRDRTGTRPLSRVILRDLIFPSLPARPLVLFCYMYLVRLGLLDGLAGLRFCFYHAWFEATVGALRTERR